MRGRKISGWLLSLAVVFLVFYLFLFGAGPREEKDNTITYTMFSCDINSQYENMESPVGRKITELTGVRLQMEYPVGDVQQKIALMIASGDYPDLIYFKGSEGPKLVDAGALVKLDPYIEKYGDNIKKLYGAHLNRLRFSLQDPSIYGLGSMGVGGTEFDTTGGFQLQHAVVMELGYPRLKTLKDLEEALLTYIENNPVIDGQDTIGLSLLADDWRFMISVTNPAFYATGAPDDGEFYIDSESFQAVLHHTRPEEKEYFRWLNHMNHTGLLDPESFVQKHDQYLAKIASGRVLALADAKWQYGPGEQALRQAGKEERMYGLYPLVLDERYKYAAFRPTGYQGGYGVGITVKCQDPAGAFNFLDWMASDEAQILNNWGIEGLHYHIVDGKRVIPADEWEKRNTDPYYQKKTGIGVYAYPFPQYGDGVKDPTGQYYTPNFPGNIIAGYTETERKVLAAYGVEMWKDLFPPEEEFTVSPWGVGWKITVPDDPAYLVPWQKIQEIIRKRIPEAILAAPGEFDGVWDKFLAELDAAGLQQCEEIFTRCVFDTIELWNMEL